MGGALPGALGAEKNGTNIESQSRFVPNRVATLVCLVGALVTAAVTWTSWTLNNHNEHQLLERQTQQIGLLIQAAVPNSQSPLASAADVAEATDGDPAKFQRFMATYVGAKHQFTSASLWEQHGSTDQLVTTTGRSRVPIAGPQVRSAIAKAFHDSKLTIVGALNIQHPYIAYAYAIPGAEPGFAVYAERELPADRRSTLQSNSAFADLDYAIYLGTQTFNRNLLTTDFAHLPPTGSVARTEVPFGDSNLTIVTRATGPLAGTFPQWLPWIFAIFGALLTIVASAIARHLVRSRRSAERATTEIFTLYSELDQLFSQQRTIAETLQHALLPQNNPDIPGLEIAVRYLPGAKGVDIGGDWYSVIGVGDDDHFAFVVGDVSGRGVSAAAIMARLRFTIRAYALEGHSPTTILEKCARQLNIVEDGHFATVLVGVGSVERHEITIASAGHLNPLIISGESLNYAQAKTGVPLGVPDPRYEAVTFIVPPNSTVIGFTDGLVERRGESLEVGLNRLVDAARGDSGSLDELLSKIISELSHDQSEDDIAILGLRWTS